MQWMQYSQNCAKWAGVNFSTSNASLLTIALTCLLCNFCDCNSLRTLSVTCKMPIFLAYYIFDITVIKHIQLLLESHANINPPLSTSSTKMITNCCLASSPLPPKISYQHGLFPLDTCRITHHTPHTHTHTSNYCLKFTLQMPTNALTNIKSDEICNIFLSSTEAVIWTKLLLKFFALHILRLSITNEHFVQQKTFETCNEIYSVRHTRYSTRYILC